MPEELFRPVSQPSDTSIAEAAAIRVILQRVCRNVCRQRSDGPGIDGRSLRAGALPYEVQFPTSECSADIGAGLHLLGAKDTRKFSRRCFRLVSPGLAPESECARSPPGGSIFCGILRRMVPEGRNCCRSPAQSA